MKRPVALAIMSVVLLVGPAAGEDPVDFVDPNLKAAVESVLKVYDPSPADMLGLTSLNLSNRGVADLTGLQHATNLQWLWIRWNSITDFSPLSGLINLQHLDAHDNPGLVDISPLSGLVSLQTLVLRWNDITDISPLSGLTNLRELNLFYCDVSDLSPLAGLTNLQRLDLNRNEIRDISALSELTSLEYLDLRNNPLNDEACDIHIPQIQANNPGAEIRYDPCGDCSIVISSTAGGSVTSPGEGTFTCRIGEEVYLQARAEPGFVFSHWFGGYSGPQSSTSFPTNGDQEIRAYFLSTSEVICVDDDAADDPGPRDAGVSDPRENGTDRHPFDSIQEAIEVAADGACVVVRSGTYQENIDFLGKSIQLVGVDPNDPNDAALPVIDGAAAGPVVTFAGGEDPNCLLMGFTLTGGQGWQGGAIVCARSSPTIANCLIVGNLATFVNGAAVYCTDSNAALLNCTIADNYGGSEGAALVLEDSEVMLANSILWANRPQEILVSGTGDPSISYTDVAGGWPGPGNFDADPLFVRHVSWADANDPDVLLGPGSSAAVRIDGDYHLQSQAGRWDGQTQAWVHDEVTSPCIDAGDPASPLGAEPVPHGGLINLGAYGGTADAAKSPQSL